MWPSRAGRPSHEQDVPARLDVTCSSRRRIVTQPPADACCGRPRAEAPPGGDSVRVSVELVRAGSASGACGWARLLLCAWSGAKSTGERSISSAPIHGSPEPRQTVSFLRPFGSAAASTFGHPWSSCARGSRAPWRDVASWAGMSAWSLGLMAPWRSAIRTVRRTTDLGRHVDALPPSAVADHAVRRTMRHDASDVAAGLYAT